jgi:uncharacterized protein with PQ loop repeat
MPKTKKSSQKMIGYMMYVVAVGMPLTTIPQLQQLYSTKVTTGLSLSTWIMYTIFGVVPLLYALSNKLRPLILTNILWMVVDLAMIYGIIVYSPGMIPHAYDKLLLINNIGKEINYIGLFCLSIAFAFFAVDIIHEEKSA